MAVDDSNVIDFISMNREQTVAFLTISDHLDWSDSLAHQLALQDKFNAYLRFAESGEMIGRYPQAKGLPIVFDVRLMHPPTEEGLTFFERAREVIEAAGFTLKYGMLSSQVH